MVAGELVQAAAEGRSDVAVDEAAMMLAARIAKAVSRGERTPVKTTEADRRRAVEAALWLEANAAEPVGLEDAARRAAKLLAQGGMPVTEVALEAGFGDLSNFVRTFGRAAGMSPARFSKHRPAALAQSRFFT